MTIILELSEYQEARLRDLASQRGQNIQEYILSQIDDAILQEQKSPLDVGSVKLNVTTEEMVEFIHEGRGNHRW